MFVDSRTLFDSGHHNSSSRNHTNDLYRSIMEGNGGSSAAIAPGSPNPRKRVGSVEPPSADLMVEERSRTPPIRRSVTQTIPLRKEELFRSLGNLTATSPTPVSTRHPGVMPSEWSILSCLLSSYDLYLARLSMIVEQQHRIDVRFFWEKGQHVLELITFKTAMEAFFIPQHQSFAALPQAPDPVPVLGLASLSMTEEEGEGSSQFHLPPSHQQQQQTGSGILGRGGESLTSSTTASAAASSSNKAMRSSLDKRLVTSSSTNALPSPDSANSLSKSNSSTAFPHIDEIELEHVHGLYKLRAELESMLCQPGQSRTRGAFNVDCPPERRLYIQSDRGSGVSTLVRAVCKRNKLNLMTIPIEVDITFKEDLYLHVIEYARAIQPCVVLFDRCDVWWNNQWYNQRGEKFIMWLRTFRQLERESCWFIFSCDSPLEVHHQAFRLYIGFRFCVEFSSKEEDRWKCFTDQFKRLVFGLKNSFEVLPDDIDSTLDSALEAINEACREYAHSMEAFTPSMICEFCERVMKVARKRGISQTKPLEPLDIIDVLPIESDFSFVQSSIESTAPGMIIWRY